MHLIRHVLTRQFGERLGSGDLHRLVDRASTHIERSAEDVGKAENVVDLVGIVAAAGGDDRVRTGFACFFRCDLGIGIRHREDDRLVGHPAYHVLGHRAFYRQPENYIGAVQRIGQRTRVGGRGMGGLPLVHAVGAALIDHALGVAKHDVLRPHAHRLQQLDACDARGTGAVHHQLSVAQFAAGQVAGVDQSRGGDDGSAMLVVVEHRDVHQLAQPLLDHEALRCLDVLQVDATESDQEADGVHHVIDVLGADLEIDAVNVGETLEQRDLAFHHRLRRHRAEIAQAQHRGAVRHHRDHVALGGVIVGERRIALDVQAGLRDARRIGKRQIARGGDRLRDARLQFAGSPGRMQRQRLFRRYVCGSRIDAAVCHVWFPHGAPLSAVHRHHADVDRVMEAVGNLTWLASRSPLAPSGMAPAATDA